MHMTLLEEIREYLATEVDGARRLTTVGEKYPAWTIRSGVEFGVAVPYSSDEPVAETFASCAIHARNFTIEGYSRFLVLTSTDSTLRYEFSSVCADFAEPGKNGEKRLNLINNPFEWWENWRELLGNAVSEAKVYSVIGEMMALDSLVREKKDVIWEAVNGGTHDIESVDAGYEVKSTIEKYNARVTISSQNQMEDDKKRLFLYFCRLESSTHGTSINDMVERLVADGYDRTKLEKQLEQMGYEEGSMSRTKRYKCLEKRKYTVDDNFPKITKDSFREDKLPKSIVKIDYTVDLDGLDYDKW